MIMGDHEPTRYKATDSRKMIATFEGQMGHFTSLFGRFTPPQNVVPGVLGATLIRLVGFTVTILQTSHGRSLVIFGI